MGFIDITDAKEYIHYFLLLKFPQILGAPFISAVHPRTFIAVPIHIAH